MRVIILTFLLIPLMLISQTPEETIKEMKDGVILVRLMTREKSIQAMVDMDKPEAAQQLRDKQKEENLEVIKAFEENFDFCPVMYFYASCTEKIMGREFDACVMNAELELASEEAIAGISTFFVSEFGQVESTDEPYFTSYSLEESEDGSKEIRSNYGGDVEIGATALVIRGPNFKQLGDPFPYFVRTREGLPWSRSASKAVAKLNENLYDYYKKFH